jgi:hypothetical protein
MTDLLQASVTQSEQHRTRKRKGSVTSQTRREAWRKAYGGGDAVKRQDEFSGERSLFGFDN